MKNYWLLLVLSVALGTTFGWTMNYIDYGHRDAFFGEITMDGEVHALNVMETLKQYHSDTTAKAEVLTETTHDFGAMGPGTKGTHEFVIKNVGTEPLELELGATTCKCTLGSLENSELAPGESTSVELEWVVNSTMNQFEQSAELRTNDPTQPAIRLKVIGLVIREIEFHPKSVTFGEVLSGESFEFTTKLYSYYEKDIKPYEVEFGSEDLTKLSEYTIEPFEPSSADGLHKRARQGFDIKVKVKPGMRQGPINTNLLVGYTLPGGQPLTPEEAANANGDDEVHEDYFASASCAGRVIGALTMLESAKLKSGRNGGGYIWNLGRLGGDDELQYKALVAMKGSERDTTNLTIGETYPADVIEAKFDAPIGKGKMRLFPLRIKLKASDSTIDLLGKNKDDFGWVWIESDNPKVSRMRVAVKTLIEPRP